MVRILLLLLTLLYAVYTGMDSYTLTTTGLASEIPQLVGDGGGGLVYTLLLVVAGGISLRWNRVSAALFGVSAILALWIGMIYQDSMMVLWTIGSVVLGCLQVVSYIMSRRVVMHRSSESTTKGDNHGQNEGSSAPAKHGRSIPSQRVSR